MVTYNVSSGEARADPPEGGVSATRETSAETSWRSELPAGRGSEVWQSCGAVGVSALLHTLLLVLLGVLVFEDAILAEVRVLVAQTVPSPRPLDRPVEIELNEEIRALSERTLEVFNASPATGITGSAPSMGTPTLEERLVDLAEATELSIAAPTIGILDATELIGALPEGEAKGEPRDVVDNYQQAMDRLALELRWLLDRGPVLAVWVFDQSASMRDDQREIRDRFENVYDQLGIVGDDNSDALLTAVTSYGEQFQDHTRERPTSNRTAIRQAIDAIPADLTGNEFTCQAVGRAIALYRKTAGRRRQMVVILVTDESGDAANNNRYLEPAIAEARGAGCRIYVLGREAVFGYPYAFIRWRHPDTDRVHWLQIDRGPETGFPELLQTNGFRRRDDAFSSGFGPYALSRMARETNGIFFMLPSVEDQLVGGENKHRYELQGMRPFLPDLRSRNELLQDRERYPLRSLIWQVISDLNPYDERAQKYIELSRTFPLDPAAFAQHARENQGKARLVIRYMADAQRALEGGRQLREREASPRWQANYDLIYAQLVAYQARIYEYGVGLDAFMGNWQREHQRFPPRRPSGDVLLEWHVTTRHETLTEQSRPYIREATRLLEQVAEDYPGTPWAARAQWELRQGYGVYLRPYYDRPWKEVARPSPLPRL